MKSRPVLKASFAALSPLLLAPLTAQAAPFDQIHIFNYWGNTTVKAVVPDVGYVPLPYKQVTYFRKRSDLPAGFYLKAAEAGASGQDQQQFVPLSELDACWEKLPATGQHLQLTLENYSALKGWWGYGKGPEGQLYRLTCEVYQNRNTVSEKKVEISVTNERDTEFHVRFAGATLIKSITRPSGSIWESISNALEAGYNTVSREKAIFSLGPDFVIPAHETRTYTIPEEHHQAEYRYVYLSPTEIDSAFKTYESYRDLDRTLSQNRKIRIVNPDLIARHSVALLSKARPEIAHASRAPLVNAEEEAALQKRKEVTSHAIQHFAKTNHGHTPNIGIAYSGGGLRAMYGSLGFSLGLEEAGLLDTVQVAAGLSGSTWFLTKWLRDHSTKSLHSITQELTADINLIPEEIRSQNQATLASRGLEQLHKGTWYTPENEFLAQLEASKICRNSLCLNFFKYGAVDLWGHTLAQSLFPGDAEKYTFTLSSMAHTLSIGKMPIPIFTAIRTGSDDHYEEALLAHQLRGSSLSIEDFSKRDYHWLDLTPFTASFLVSSPLRGHQETHIPAWALGRKFQNSISVAEPQENYTKAISQHLRGEQFRAEPSASQLMGAFGSAFSVSLQELADADSKAGAGIHLAGALGSLLISKATGIKHETMLDGFQKWIKRTNPAKGLSLHDFTEEQEQVEVRDGGFFFNLPIPSLFDRKRNLDLAVVFDTSGDLHDHPASELLKFRKFSSEREYFGKKVPMDLMDEAIFKRKLDDAIHSGIAVFNDPRLPSFRPEEMTIAYIPTLERQNFPLQRPTETYSTFKLDYRKSEVDTFVRYSSALAHEVSPQLKQVIQALTEALNRDGV